MEKIIKLHESDSVPVNFTGIIEWLNIDNIIVEKHYIKGDMLHRDNDPAVEWSNGTKEWWVDGNLHRLDGPAVEYANGTKQWYKDGKHHREDGPAIEHVNGDKLWYLEGKVYFDIDLNSYIILDCYQGKFDLMWYKLLSKNKVFDYPDIPGLITK